MAMDNNFYITIGREKGAGGTEIAKLLSSKFNIPLYDKQLLDLAAKESGLCKELFEQIDERKGTKYFSSMQFGNFVSSFAECFTSSPIGRSELFKIQSQTIETIAQKGSAIFIGRCADYVLRENPNCLNVFITASKDDRLKRLYSVDKIKDFENMSKDELYNWLEESDKRRSSYYNYFTYKQWGASSSYHLCLDSTFLGIEACVEIISKIIKENGWA